MDSLREPPPGHDPVTGCLAKVFTFLLVVAVFVIFSLGALVGAALAGGF